MQQLINYMREATDKLENSKLGESCLILGAGPSLSRYSAKDLEALAEGKTVFAIKQAYVKCPHLVDYHFLNDNNFTPFAYDRTKTSVVVALPINHQPEVLVRLADYLFIVEQNWDFSRSLSGSYNFGDWTIKKQPVYRPWGPGITYEVVFYFAHLMGFTDLYTIGWDLGAHGSQRRSHFYDSDNIQVANPAAALSRSEADGEIKLTKKFNEWLIKEGVALRIVNRDSYADESIERV